MIQAIAQLPIIQPKCGYFGRHLGTPSHGAVLHRCERFHKTCTQGPNDLIVDRAGTRMLSCTGCKAFIIGPPPPAIDVIITSHNYGHFLNECLDSVDCTGQLIVVDDASDPDDETKAICDRRGVRYLRTEFQSPHLARGAGFALCRSPLVCFLDADNTHEPGYLSAAAELFASNPRLAIVYPDLQNFGDDSKLRQQPAVFDIAQFERMNVVDTGAVWLAEAIQQTGSFSRDPEGHEDWRLARDIMRSGQWEAAHNPVPLNYRKHGIQRCAVNAAKPYYEYAGLADETVTVFLTVSGRSHKNTAYFDRHKRWLLDQKWPRNQVRVLIANTSHQPLPPEWLMGLTGFAGVSWYDHPVGRPGLEDENRSGAPMTELEVQTVVAAINNRMLLEANTEFVLSIENDVFPESLDAIEHLMRGFDAPVCAVSGAYRQRYEPQHWTAWRNMPPNGRPQLPRDAGHKIETIYGCGLGCVMLRRSQVMSEVITGRTATSGYYDADWFHRLNKSGHRVRINWDVRCEHAGIGVKLTVLLPTTGRETLGRAIRRIKSQLRDKDEVWLLSDGPANNAILAEIGGSVKLIEITNGPHGDWGHTPRNQVLPLVESGYVIHLDDDDTLASGALRTVRQAIARHNGDLFLFQMRREDGSIIPVGNVLESGNVGTPMFVHPAKIQFGSFAPKYGGDFDFIEQTIKANPIRTVRWIPAVIVDIRHERPEIVIQPTQPHSGFANCANLRETARIDECDICGQKGIKVEVRSCSQFGECAPRRYKTIPAKNPQICNRQCPGFTEKLIQLELT